MGVRVSRQCKAAPLFFHSRSYSLSYPAQNPTEHTYFSGLGGCAWIRIWRSDGGEAESKKRKKVVGFV